MLTASLNDLIETEGRCILSEFNVVTETFIEYLQESNDLDSWTKLIKLQVAEMKPLLADLNAATNNDDADASNSSNEDKTPAKDFDSAVRKMKMFLPLHTEKNSIPCSLQTCKSTFKHKREGFIRNKKKIVNFHNL